MTRRGGGRAGFAPEGRGVLAFSAALVVALVIVSLAVGREGRLLWMPALGLIWFVAAAQFFRDPERIVPPGERLILSPADGKIISIGQAMEDHFGMAGEVGTTQVGGSHSMQRVSIFMSPVNVHVNRSPATGTVTSVEYRKGKFVSAYKPAASRANEQNIILMETGFGPVAFKQIAGFLARRVVFHPKAGDRLTAGQRVGIIKFGSRVDLFFRESAQVKVRLGQKVTAGETVIAEFIA